MKANFIKMQLSNDFKVHETQPVNSSGNQSRIFIGRTDAKAEALIFWPPYAKN